MHGATFAPTVLRCTTSESRQTCTRLCTSEHEQVGRDRVAHQPRGYFGCVHKPGSIGTASVDDLPLHAAERKLQVGAVREGGGHDHRRIDHRLGHADSHLGQRVFSRRGQYVTAEHQLRLACSYARGVQHGLRGCDADVAGHRAILLRKARHVKNGHALAFEERGHAEHLTDGQHTGAANAGREDVVGLGERWNGRRWNIAKFNRTDFRGLLQPPKYESTRPPRL